jgi:uncharacterized protein (DUF58 family)
MTVWQRIFSSRSTAGSETRIQLRMRLPVLWLFVLLLGALLLPDRIWITFLIGFGGLFLVSFAWVWLLGRGLHASRRLRFGWVAVGDRLQEVFTVINNTDVPALWIEIVDESNVPGYQAAIVRSLGAREKDQWRESAVCLRRGLFHLGPWEIRSGDPFGIFTVSRRYPQQKEIIIHPPIHGNLSLPLPQGQSSGRARARQRAWQATINAASVRDYQTNDPYNWIHWPTSARRGDLFVRQFDLDAAGDIWILLDLEVGKQLGSGSAKGTEEQAILLAASLTARALNQTRRVGLVAHGQQPWIVQPGIGQGQQWRILRALALLKADGDVPLEIALRDLSHMAQRGAAAVIITPSTSPDWLPELATLSRSGVFSHVFLLDRPSFGGEGESIPIRDTVRMLGYNADIIHLGDLGDPLQEQQDRQGFWEFKVTSLGKVVAVKRPGK